MTILKGGKRVYEKVRSREYMLGDLLKLNQVCALSNLGATTVRRLAEESGAVRKIGKSYRIHCATFFSYIEKEYAKIKERVYEKKMRDGIIFYRSFLKV